jgi:hypothetical protein
MLGHLIYALLVGMLKLDLLMLLVWFKLDILLFRSSGPEFEDW